MSGSNQAAAAALIAASRDAWQGDREASLIIDQLEQRLAEPVRIALAGMVKAGKSTLLNALLGEHIAPTDAGECTRLVTWYRYSASPQISVHLGDGTVERLPVRRQRGQVVLDLGGRDARGIHHIEIGWPSEVLRSMTVIDTPGIESLSQRVSERTTRFLVPDDSPSSADAIIYLMRHLHPKDTAFLEAFRDTAAGVSRTVNAVAVLSRADEIGSGRIDSLLSAGKVAARYERDGGLQSLALGVLPIAGLLAEAARTLREQEFVALGVLAAMPRGDRERLLVSSDRFVRPSADVALDAATRAALLDRFGIYGIRLASSLMRVGMADSSELAEALIQHSGLNQLEEFLSLHLVGRGEALKARAAAEAIAWLLANRPLATDPPVVRAALEQLHVATTELDELRLLSQARCSTLPLQPQETAAAVRAVGGRGLSPAARLGLSEEADLHEVRAALIAELDSWRASSHAPLIGREALEACRVVMRSLEKVASLLGGHGADADAPDVVALGGPREGGA